MQVINICFFSLINLCPEYFARYYRQESLPLKILTGGQRKYDEKVHMVPGVFSQTGFPL